MKNYKQIQGIQGKLNCDYISHLSKWSLPKSKYWPHATLSSLEDFFQLHLKKLSKNSHTLAKNNWSFNVSVVGKTKMKSINSHHRNKNYSTDVLSFPLHDWTNPQSLTQSAEISQFNLGDIVICKDVMQRQAKQFKLSVMDEYLHLLVHGFLHLLGYDHEISLKHAKVMESHEKRILENISRFSFVTKK
jgi:probable rRNA maturation factor